MTPTAAGKAAVWTAAISVSAVEPHATAVALAAAVAKEVFDLVHARMHRTSVLAYLRDAGKGTDLCIDLSPAAPALVLSIASPGPVRSDDEKGADPVPADGEYPPAGSCPDPGDFCIKQRADWLAYAAARTRSWPDAEDAVSHVVQKILEHHARYGTLCPVGRDPVAWSKTVIRNYLIDRYRRGVTEHKRSPAFVLPAGDIADAIADQIIARKALVFMASLDPRAHTIAMMRWVDGLEPKEIARQLDMNPRSVSSSLHRTQKKMRIDLGVVEPQKILREGTT
jgi:RNA polymerase sigma factor (sigma-70 family)